jgi:hypothetical protein
MKLPLPLLALLSLCAPPAFADEAPKAPPRCISSQDIENMEVVDDYTILFHMRGGKIWKNTLKTQCYGLGFERAIAYETWGGELCANAQPFRVVRRGTFCTLGSFEAYRKQPPKDGDTSPSQ